MLEKKASVVKKRKGAMGSPPSPSSSWRSCSSPKLAGPAQQIPALTQKFFVQSNLMACLWLLSMSLEAPTHNKYSYQWHLIFSSQKFWHIHLYWSSHYIFWDVLVPGSWSVSLLLIGSGSVTLTFLSVPTPKSHSRVSWCLCTSEPPQDTLYLPNQIDFLRLVTQTHIMDTK
jgi:hypothetical protein